MEWYYRLVMGQRSDCARNEHVELLLSCALPEIDLENLSFENLEEILPRLFFSQKKITKKFGDVPVLERLLQCDCKNCDTQSTGNPQTIRDEMLGSPKGSFLLLALVLLIYLDRLHYIHPLISLGSKKNHSLQSIIKELDPDNKRMRGLIAMKEEDLNLIYTPEKKLSAERRAEKREKTRQWERLCTTFKAMRDEVSCMFEPVIIRLLNQKDSCQWYPQHYRFPFLDAEDRVPQGSFGTVTKFRIPSEYLHGSIKGFMESRYRGSRDEATGEYLFVRKSLVLQKSELPHKPTTGSNEGTAARLASMISGDAADNIISLLSLYTWGDSLYFIFPCLKTDLYHLLRQTTLPGDQTKPTKLRSNEELPKHWLWKQMIGVAHALSAIHTKMKHPHGGVEGYIIASHFDLKPANILVTSEGVLKVTDFGESVISVTKSLENMSTPFRPGDPKYAAPESRPSEAELARAYGAGEDSFQVLLNYDVWALACVMTEVLVVLLDTEEHPAGTAIDRFHAKLEKESRIEETRGTFLEGGHELKPYARKVLENFPKLPRFARDDPQKWYMQSVSNLLLRMFSTDSSKRPFSAQVLEELTQAEKIYWQSVEYHRDPLAWDVGQARLTHGGHSEFQEVGWGQSGSLLSFLHMDGVTLKVIDQDGSVTAGDQSQGAKCRFQLFYRASALVEEQSEPGPISLSKTGSSSGNRRSNVNPFKSKNAEQKPKPKLVQRPSKFILKWGVISQESNHRSPYHIKETHIIPSEWSFTPRYILNPELDLGFILFKDSANGVDNILHFEFDTLEKVRSFQAALLRYTVQGDILQAKTVNYTKLFGKLTPLFPDGGEPMIQVWAKDSPPFLTVDKAGRPQSKGPIENTQPRQLDKTPPPKALVFFEKRSDMQFALHLTAQVTNKLFNDSRHLRGIVCTRGPSRDHFPLICIPSGNRRPKQNVNKLLWKSSMPLIQGLVEPDVSQDDVDKKRVVLKLKEMELIMETQVGYKTIKSHVQGAWEK